MKRTLSVIMACILALTCLWGCGKTEEVTEQSESSVEIVYEEEEEEPAEEEEPVEEEEPAEEESDRYEVVTQDTPGNSEPADGTLDLSEVSWKAVMGSDDGNECVCLDFVNNSKYPVTLVEIDFSEKEGVSEAQKEPGYQALEEAFDFDDSVSEWEKTTPFSAGAETMKVIMPGKTRQIPCTFFGGDMYLTSLEFFNVLEPNYIFLWYANTNGHIYRLYHDYKSGETSNEDSYYRANQWTLTPLSAQIPATDHPIVNVTASTEKEYKFEMCGATMDDFNAYVEKCKNMGFVNNPDEEEGFYKAVDTNAHYLRVSFDETDGTVYGTVEKLDESN